MKKIGVLLMVFSVFLFFTQSTGAENEIKIDLNPMQLFHAVMIANGFHMNGKPVVAGDKTAMIYVKKDGDKWFQSGCCFYFGGIERILIWSQKGISLKKYKKLVKRIFEKIIQIHGKDVSAQDFEKIWDQIRQDWQKGGVRFFYWKDAMIVYTNVDNINYKIKIESFDPSQKPET